MKSTTIDFGIDLGTTNRTIARINGVDIVVFKNNEGFEFTPSAVWMDSKERLHVGRRAKDQLENDTENAFSEFKLQMGTETQYTFERNKKKMSPEELTSEILKALKEDVKKQLGEEITSVVITVPAAFEFPQSKSTNKSAELAGFIHHPLLQEPIAVAMAYGFQCESSNKIWMVYDFGGGTFDASIIQVKDGHIQILNHGGDYGLGGKNLDWEIVNSLLAPAAAKENNLINFTMNNKQFREAFAKLKAEAEKAKIRLSLEDSVDIHIDTLYKNDKGEAVEFTYELLRSEFEKLAKPYIIQSINICKKVLMEKRLGTSNIEKMILVGGTSLIPYLSDMLLDSNDGLGIPLESSINPLTVVAIGAAIFAGTQRLPIDISGQVNSASSESSSVSVIDFVEVQNGSGKSRIEFCVGDLTELGANAAVDVLIVSAFPDCYGAVPGSLIAALEKKGIIVEDLAKRKAVDLRQSFSCWMSSELANPRGDIPFRRILCFEPYVRGTPAELVGDIFRSLAPFVGGEPPVKTVATSIVATGNQGVDTEKMLRLLVEAAMHWMSVGLPLTCFKVVCLPSSNVSTLTNIFKDIKHKSAMSIRTSLHQYKYDVFVSYAHADQKEVSIFEQRLVDSLPEIKLFIDRKELNTGTSWQQEIYESLDNCKKIIAFLTPSYLKSKVCLEEFNIALCRNRESSHHILLPIYFYSAPLPTYMKVLHFWDCREFAMDKIEKISQELAQKLNNEV